MKASRPVGESDVRVARWSNWGREWTVWSARLVNQQARAMPNIVVFGTFQRFFTLTLASLLLFHNAAGSVKGDSQLVTHQDPSSKFFQTLYSTSYRFRDSASFGLSLVVALHKDRGASLHLIDTYDKCGHSGRLTHSARSCTEARRRKWIDHSSNTNIHSDEARQWWRIRIVKVNFLAVLSKRGLI